MQTITSRDNSRLVAARKIIAGKDRARILVEGRRLVNEALRSEIEFDECFVTSGFDDDQLLVNVANRCRFVGEMSARLFHTVADTGTSQGIILIAQRPETSLERLERCLRPATLPIVVMLNGINNPANLGAIFRTAEAADAAGIIVSKNSADAFSPKALRAAMGASFRMPIRVDAGFGDAVAWARSHELLVTAADVSATQDYSQVDWKRPRLLIFGSEAHGLSSDELASVDETICIKMANQVDSLNLAVSAGIILFESKRHNQ